MYRGPKEKKERSLGERLNLKGERCASPKCAAVRKPYKPGMHGPKARRKTPSEFGLQLKEKQKFKVSYGVGERGLRNVFRRASKAKGSSALKIVEFLERRLDNAIFRLGFAPSRGAARQLIVQGHIMVNGGRVRSPGFLVKKGDVIGVRAESGSKQLFVKRMEVLKKFEPPAWLHLDAAKLEGRVLSPPEESIPFEANLVVESFSK
ncbi:MAG TPA: 30S ribosomal protein S4 [Candidatus Paceibacterota bacterium]|nr:30S ribosomal protein S4 [Candidatus Paceibacterota bacterium]